MLQHVLLAALAALATYVAPALVASSERLETNGGGAACPAEDPCAGCKEDSATVPFVGGGCTVTLNIVGQDGICIGKRPPAGACSVTRFCWFVTQPLCDNTCCVPQFQDAAGNWNTVLCGQNTGIWQHPCQWLAIGVNWRVTDFCATPPVMGFGAAAYQCTPCQ